MIMKKRPSKQAPLEPWQMKDAERLKTLFERYKAAGGLSQEAFGERYEIGNQSAVSQYLNGKIALNLTAAMKFARGLGQPIARFSPSLAKELPEQTPLQGELFDALLRTMIGSDGEEAVRYMLGRMKKAGIAQQAIAGYELQLRSMLRQLEVEPGERKKKK